MISNETVKHIKERSRGICENPLCATSRDSKHVIFECHHIYWRSQYRKQDRDDLWNLAYICKQCHFEIHNGTDRRIDSYFKRCADKRKPTNERSSEISRDIVNARKTRKNAYKRIIERYKENNAGLSPSQVAYRRRKAYKDKLANK